MVKTSGYTHMDATELRLARRWLDVDGKRLGEVAKLLGRDHSTIRRNLGKVGEAAARHGAGRPRAVSPAMFKALKKALDALLKQAGGGKEVKVSMVKRRAGVTVGDKTVLNAFHEHGVWFRPLKEKPILTRDDMAERRAWGEKYAHRTRQQWVRNPHAIIDNKNFQVYGNKAGRDHAARRRVRGAYRSQADGLKPELVKPKKQLKFPAKSIQVTAAVVNGRIRMWHYVEGRWKGAAAAEMYKGPLRKTLERNFPGRRSWVVLEDNDPTGYQSSKGRAAKDSAHIVSMGLPKRSPDLNVLDYSLWKAVNDRMRAAEQTFPKAFRETKAAFAARLRRTALRLPEAEVTKAVQSMRRRTLELAQNGGRLVKEGI